SYEP
ncbi:hypothetical protein D047_3350B, partial [Vibrio parahaemolyticus VPTS-2010_2]